VYQEVVNFVYSKSKCTSSIGLYKCVYAMIWMKSGAIISAAQDTSNKLLVTTLEGLVATNVANVQAKFEKIADPLAAKELAASALADATSALKTKTNTKKDEKVLAEAAHKGALESALATKNTDVANRKEALRVLQGIASTTHDEDKAFVDGYCTESKEDLETEKGTLKSIEQKLGGLLVTKDDKVGKDAEDACPANVDGDCQKVPGNSQYKVTVCNNGIRIIQHTILSNKRLTANEQKYKCTGYASGGWGVHQAHNHDCTATSPETATESKMWTNSGHTYGCSFDCTPITCV